jgi:tetraacyldisaccharide 4'-kinase
VSVVTVGGATLGGSGKTPLAIACAAYLAGAGGRVALVGHAYRAAPGRARVVRPDDAVEDVGDEALLAARALEAAPGQACVVVAPSRGEAVALASRRADVLVLDGVLQIAPARASLALLAVDAEDPWGGAPRVPPAGYLRAPVGALLDASDRVVAVGDGAGADARLVSRGAWSLELEPDARGPALLWPSGGGALHTWEALARARVGLLCALARPERILRALARRGVTVREVVRARDHGPFGDRDLVRARAAGAGLDLWLATPKCALHVPLHVRNAPGTALASTLALTLGAPLATLDGRVDLPHWLRTALRGACSGHADAPVAGRSIPSGVRPGAVP